MKTIIVENLSKCYRKGGYNPYQSLRDAFSGILRKRREEGIIWALKDVSFEVEEGEVLGIIGPNGAGKTTLLKILSRITEPTSGRAIVRGRVGSLLEVGVGFHPELTGRENIYLNGAILGMKKSEIDRKFDEIVEFAELSEFIDTPIKYYSSGMRVRLAFSISAYLDTDVVLVDEVLAVGDIAFQQKCGKKLREVSSAGKTIIMVSHNMRVVEALTNKCIYLKDGKIEKEGSPLEVIKHYQKDMMERGLTKDLPVRFQTEISQPSLICEDFKFLNEESVETMSFETNASFTLTFNIVALRDIPNAVICFRIYKEGILVSGNNSEHTIGKLSFRKNEKRRVKIKIKSLSLIPGIYTVLIFVLPSYFASLEDSLSRFYAFNINVYGSKNYGGGYVYLEQSWEII